MIKILCIESATEICSVCLAENGHPIASRENTDGNQHSRVLTILIEETMREAGISLREIDAVALSGGPGSYTSLRVGASVAKGICYALEKPLISVDTLQSLAMAAAATGVFSEKTAFIPMIDARRMEVYLGIFDKNGKSMFEPQPMIIEPDSFQKWTDDGWQIIYCGNGAEKCRPFFNPSNMVFLDIKCAARQLTKLSFLHFQQAHFQQVAYFEPKYMKLPNITSPKILT
jgi:tRNA threonylcarbamoyladenosine biosynthesis protein TsaB